MINDLLLLSKNDIPFIEAQLIIHQPTIKEIAYIGEEVFNIGCELINFSKDMLDVKDKKILENKTNFDILLTILDEQNAVMRKNRNCLEMVLSLIFPLYTIKIQKNNIVLKKDEEEYFINNDNFEVFKNIFNKMFCYIKKDDGYNPSGPLSQKIAEKLRKGRQKVSELKNNQKQKNSILGLYISILAVGEHKDINSLLNYSVFQIYDELKRYRMKEDYDMYIKAKLAGAKDLKEIQNWMSDIHE